MANKCVSTFSALFVLNVAGSMTLDANIHHSITIHSLEYASIGAAILAVSFFIYKFIERLYYSSNKFSHIATDTKADIVDFCSPPSPSNPYK